MPKGSFYNHFGSKEALGAEVVECYGQDNPRLAALADTSIPPLQRLRAQLTGLRRASLPYFCRASGKPSANCGLSH